MPNGGEHYERLGSCPRCGSLNIRTRRQRHRRFLWRCRACNRVFETPKVAEYVIPPGDDGRRYVFADSIPYMERRARRRRRSRRSSTAPKLIAAMVLVIAVGAVGYFVFTGDTGLDIGGSGQSPTADEPITAAARQSPTPILAASIPTPIPTDTPTPALLPANIPTTVPATLPAADTPTPDSATALESSQGERYVGGNPLDPREIEKWVIEFTNEERVSRNLRTLRHDSEISEIARSHSKDMGRLQTLSHVIGGKDATDRSLAAGYDCRAYRGDGSYTYGLSENIAEHPRVTLWRGRGVSSWYPQTYYRDAKEAAQSLVSGWMSSSGHRENILDRESRRVGVGIFIRESPEYGYTDETIYATQGFSACQ